MSEVIEVLMLLLAALVATLFGDFMAGFVVSGDRFLIRCRTDGACCRGPRTVKSALSSATPGSAAKRSQGAGL